MPRTPDENRTGRQRVAEMQAQQASADRRRKIALGGAAVLAAAAVIGGGAALASHKDHPTSQASGSSTDIRGVKVWSNLGRNHVDGDPHYAMTPPVGGDHNQAWANCGVYDKKIPDKYAVHSLEHGAVWITTNTKASAKDIATLKKSANQDYMLMSRYPTQPSPITLSAWGHQLNVKSASDPRVQQFIKAYLNGPQTPEPGAACTGGYDPNTGTIGGSM